MDKEQRAHDLAVSYVHYKCIAELFDEDSIKLAALEADYYDDYRFAYDTFLDRLDSE